MKIIITFIFLTVLNFSLTSQTLKIFLKITENDTQRYNNLKYIITIVDYNKDTTYTYITSSIYVLLFEYNNIYKIIISSSNMSEHQIYFVNNGPPKNNVINLIIPLYYDRLKTVKKFLYYIEPKKQYYFDSI